MAHLGSNLFPFGGKQDGTPCICGDPLCAQLTACFQSLGDARGCKFILPSLGGSRRVEIKEHKLKRTVHHLKLGPDYKKFASIDNRNRSLRTPTPTAKSTRTAKQSPKRQAKVVAVHHYHPEIVKHLYDGNKLQFIDCVPESFLKESGLWQNGYTNADKFQGEFKVEGKDGGRVYPPVPSYKLERASDDYILVATRYRVNDIISRCSDATYGHRFLKSRGDDGEMVPVQKMPRLELDKPVDLQRAICVLADDIEKLKMKQKEEKLSMEELERRNRNADIEEYVQTRRLGLNRLNISSDRYHEKNPRVSKLYFRFEDLAKGSKLSSWDVTKQFLKDMFDVDHVNPTIDMIEDKNGRATKLSKFETCLVTLIFFQNAFEHEFIASIFGVTRHVVGRCIKYWAPHFREVGYHMARHTLTKEFLDKTYPQSYIDLGFSPPVGSIVDGTDVLVQTVRKERAVNVALASNKIKRSGVRGCTWSTPTGGVHEFTDPIMARASEKAIIRLWTGHGRFKDIPVGYLVSADKGFDGTSGYYPNYNPVIHPAFLTGGNGAQFTEEQIDWNRKACEMRYTSEVVFSRFKRYGGLGGIVRRNHFPYLRDLWAWAHGMANYYNCLQYPADDDYFPESKYTRKK